MYRVSFRFLPKRGQNKDICKVGGSVGTSILSGFSFHEHFVLLGGGGGGTVIMHSHVSISVPNEYIFKSFN